MSVYVIAQLKFTDEARYRRYQEAAAKLFRERRIKVLAADENPTVLEGEWDRDKVVVMAFEDEAQARGFLGSEAYRAISEDREAGAETVSLLVHGF